MSNGLSETREKNLRHKARKRYWSEYDKDGYECPDCGRRVSDLRTGFEVHHIDGDVENSELDNLIGLCRPCHNLREGKKPSVNEISLMRDQIEEQGAFGRTTPLVESNEAASKVYQEHKKANQPHMILKRIKRRKYVSIHIDFTSAKGWKVVDTDDGETKEPIPVLTEGAVEAINAIADKYRDAKKPTNYFSALATAHGADCIGFPPMLPEVSRRLAAETRPIVMNEANWETPAYF